jgi:hypothetical protein
MSGTHVLPPLGLPQANAVKRSRHFSFVQRWPAATAIPETDKLKNHKRMQVVAE